MIDSCPPSFLSLLLSYMYVLGLTSQEVPQVFPALMKSLIIIWWAGWGVFWVGYVNSSLCTKGWQLCSWMCDVFPFRIDFILFQFSAEMSSKITVQVLASQLLLSSSGAHGPFAIAACPHLRWAVNCLLVDEKNLWSRVCARGRRVWVVTWLRLGSAHTGVCGEV